jgi:protein-S-isoprenylcysteine O-methyltransferase Ste14
MTIGGAVALAGKKALGESHTALPEARKLVTHGIYSKIGHPIYTGLQLAFWG